MRSFLSVSRGDAELLLQNSSEVVVVVAVFGSKVCNTQTPRHRAVAARDLRSPYPSGEWILGGPEASGMLKQWPHTSPPT